MSAVLVLLAALAAPGAEPSEPLWSFAPLTDPAPRAVRDESWPRGEIDRFVLARLESRGIEPAPDADRATLLRRLTFDLIGLPPSPGEIERFVADDDPLAVERVVERLLGSRHFGERWGRHWLDVARYADSTGGGRTKALEDAWKYRDWVIDSFNRDRPFDRFLRAQIAGDLLEASSKRERRENLIATSFLVLGPHNYENQDKELLRMDVVDEQLDTTGRAFLAMTFGCARCHDHKFDPISTADYYALAGIFRATKSLTPGNVSGFVMRDLPVEGELARRLEEHDARVAALQKRVIEARELVASLQPAKGKGGAGAKGRPLAAESLPGIVIDDLDAKRVGTWKTSTFHPRFVGKSYLHDENAGKGDKRVVFAPELSEAGEYEVRLAYTPGSNRSRRAPVTVRHAGGEKTLSVDQSRPPPIDGIFISLGRYRFDRRGGSVTVSNAGTSAHVIVDAVQFLPASGESARSETPDRSGESAIDAERARRLEDAEKERKALETELAALRRDGPKRPKTMSVQDEEAIEDWHIHLRGEIRNLGPKVARGFPAALTTAVSPRVGSKESGRRELAEWMASPSNPLTARVLVNRVWYWLMGAGIVRTVDNFGATGQRPSHPELLDHLARRFIERGWSVKNLVREIVLSRTYGLDSRPPPRAASIDPENRLLSHANRKRLDSESIRDAILAASGSLDLTAGGSSIDTSAGKMAGSKIEYGYAFTTNRRSVYVPVFRNSLLEILDVFDFADPNLVVGCRANTTRSTQALFLMNSPFLLERSDAAARRLLALPALDDAARLSRAYAEILGRPPSKQERELGLAFVAGDAESADTRLRAWSGLVQSLFSCIDFRYLR